jgi:hypothetical protein
VASRVLRVSAESEMTFEATGGVDVEAVKANVVFAGSDTAAGNANVPVVPLTDGTATDCAVAATGCDVEALAGASSGTDTGAGEAATGTMVGAIVPLPHAVRIAALASASAAAAVHRPTVRDTFKQNLNIKLPMFK